MIQINLLKALKDVEVNKPDDLSVDSDEKGGFLSGLFARKSDDDDNDLDVETTPIKPIEMIIKVVLILSAPGSLYYYESINIPGLQRDLTEETGKLNELISYNNKAASSVAEIKKLQEQKEQIEKQISSLDGLSKVRLKYVRALDLIQTNLPEKMWFTAIRSKGSLIEANGISVSEGEITDYLDKMGRSVYFSDVSMISSEDINVKDNEKSKFKRFNLNFLLEGNK